jgi:hypothetical protein
MPAPAINRCLGQSIDEFVSAAHPLNDDRKRSRRFDLWLPDKVFRKPGAGSRVTGLGCANRRVDD